MQAKYTLIIDLLKVTIISDPTIWYYKPKEVQKIRDPLHVHILVRNMIANTQIAKQGGVLCLIVTVLKNMRVGTFTFIALGWLQKVGFRNSIWFPVVFFLPAVFFFPKKMWNCISSKGYSLIIKRRYLIIIKFTKNHITKK